MESNSVDNRLASTQMQVDNVTSVMHQNIQHVMDRDINLSNLERNADNLHVRANEFQTTSSKTKKWFIWRNTKWTIILVITVLVLVLVIALAIGLGTGLAK